MRPYLLMTFKLLHLFLFLCDFSVRLNWINQFGRESSVTFRRLGSMNDFFILILFELVIPLTTFATFLHQLRKRSIAKRFANITQKWIIFLLV